ncbi:hypothetical protein [Christensenella hongkongensis]|uniref:hypothetical protein n=1 Tax=Christensenella hongkongensis TaxID=270498 RepID=UPI002673DA60|nr:hypothetical protein [Christensenella hongkongensis]
MMKVSTNWADAGVDTLDKAKKQNLSRAFADAKRDQGVSQREYTEEEKQQRKENAYQEMERLYDE